MLPFSYDSSEEICTYRDKENGIDFSDAIQYEDVKFIRDIGCFKKDEIYKFIIVSYEKGEIVAIDEECDVIKRQKFEIVSIGEKS